MNDELMLNDVMKTHWDDWDDTIAADDDSLDDNYPHPSVITIITGDTPVSLVLGTRDNIELEKQ